MKQIFLFVLIFLTTCNGFVIAGSSDIHFSKITSDNGLSDNISRVILQDHKGFIWIGTQNGLNRFDGVDFKVYKNNPEAPNVLSNNLITCAEISSDSTLWVGTNHGIDYYIRDTDSFGNVDLCRITKCENKNMRFFVAALHASKNNLYALASTKDSLYLLKRDNERFDFYLLLTVPLKNKITYYSGGLSVDYKNNIWFGTHATGLYRLDNNGNLKQFEGSPLNNKTINSDFIHDIAVDPDSTVWIASYGGGISRYNIKTETFYNYSTTNLTDVNCIHIDRNNKIWIGTDKHGFANYDKETDKFFLCDEGKKQTNLSYYSVWSIFVDENNGLWMGTYNGGINYWHQNRNRFNHIEPRHNTQNWLSTGMVGYFAELDNGNVLVSTDGGSIYHFNPKNMDFEELKWDVNHIDNNIIKIIHVDKENKIWAKLQNKKLHRLKYNNRKMETIAVFPLDGKTISHSEIKTIASDNNKNVWIGTDAGLNKYNTETGKIEIFPALKEKCSLNNEYIRNIFVDNDENLWLSTINGINFFNVKENCFYSSLSNPHKYNIYQNMGINTVFKDSKNRYWVATAWNGLFMFDTISYNLTPVNPIPDFAYANICSILEDKHENLWISTKTGLFKYNHDTKYFKPYTVNDGLQSNVFNENSSLKLSDGRFIFGGINGFNIFHPDSIKDKDTASPIEITGLNLFNKNISYPDSNSILKKQISESDTIHLKHKHSVFTIFYRMLNYSNPKDIKYAYKLEPFDTEWNYVNDVNFATYTNLNPDTYFFRVKASTDNISWHEREVHLTIIISPPFYKTTWFRAILVLVVFLSVYLAYLIRTNQIRAINKELARKVKERTQQLEETTVLLEENQEEIINQKDELLKQRDQLSELNNILEQKQEEILLQNEELIKHKDNLELSVIERTKELESAKKKAEESDRLKSAFLANMSHEIRTPLNAIIGFSQLIAEQEIKQEIKEKYIGIIRNNSDTLLLLISDILDISSIEAGQMKLNKNTFNCTELLHDIYSVSEKKLNKPNIELRCKAPFSGPNIISDIHRVKQIINNFLSNAIKHTEKGEICMGYEVLNKNISFYVSDTGSGIAEDQLKNIFERFYKIDRNTTKLVRGNGLGLAISSELATMLGGRIEVKTKEGVGSTFFLILENCIVR